MNFRLKPFLIHGVLLLSSSSLLFACVDDKLDTNPEEQNTHYDEPDLECNPAGLSTDCFYPFPSDAFRTEQDGKTHITFPGKAVPAVKGKPMLFEIVNPIDGYATHTPIFADMGKTLDPDQFIFHTDDIAQSLQPTSTIVILQADTGEAIANWAELDASVPEQDRHIIQIRLLEALAPETEYIVAVQNVKDVDGQTIPRLESFEHLATSKNYPYFKEQQELTREKILPALETFGVDVDNVQVAWSFTTRSDQSARQDLESMIQQTSTWLDGLAEGPTVRIDSVTDYDEELLDKDGNPVFQPGQAHLKYWIHATVEVPMFLENETPKARMQFDGDSVPTWKDTYDLPLDILIPRSVVENNKAEATIQFGHGFFGTTEEMRSSFLAAFLNENHMVSFGINWWGLSQEDLGPITGNLGSNPSSLFNFIERLEQSFVNQTVVARAIKTSAQQLQDADNAIDYGALLTADDHVFYGISLGHILGSTAIAVSPEIDRGVLSVGGGSFSFIMSRAEPFAALMAIIRLQVNDDVATLKFPALASIAMEKIDPITYANQILEKKFEDKTVKRAILAQVGVGDPSVPTLASVVWARSAGIPIATPHVTAFTNDYGLDEISLPASANDSAFVMFDYGIEGGIPGMYSRFGDPDVDNLSRIDIHSAVRKDPRGQEQVRDFILKQGIPDSCDGVCDPD